MAEGGGHKTVVELRAGPVTALLEDGTLRYIRYRGAEIVRQVYIAVRDRNWGTVPPKFTVYDVRRDEDSFEVRLAAETVAGEIDFRWEAVVTGTADGVVTFRMRGEARSGFLRNRIGFCVLHPDSLAGERVAVTTGVGVAEGAFPTAISPHQPFFDIRAIRHGVPGVPGCAVDIAFEGDVFEMEDQRNWTDASFKTYCTPLALPFPVKVEPGDVVEQSVRIRVTAAADGAAASGAAGADAASVGGVDAAAAASGADVISGAAGAPAFAAGSPGGAGAASATGAGASAAISRVGVSAISGAVVASVVAVGSSDTVRVDLAPESAGSLPPLGLQYAAADGPIGPEALLRLQELSLGFIYVLLQLRNEGWTKDLDAAAALSRELGVPLAAAAWVGADGADEALAACCTRLARAGVRRHSFAAFGPGAATSRPAAEAARRALGAAGFAGTPLLGGTPASYVELNRAGFAGTMPYDALDGVVFGMNPQVHAFDETSIMETLPIQALAVADARAKAGGALPVHAGPVTFTQRVNPAATSAEPPPRVHDPRERKPFAAAWTLGSVRQLAAAGAASITLGDAVGESGALAGADAVPTPVYRLLAALAPFRGARLANATVDAPGTVEALALLGASGGVRLLLANLSASPRTVTAHTPPFASASAADGTPVRADGALGELSLSLAPHEIAQVDFVFTSG